MPEVNFAREREREREREQEIGLNHNLWCAVESPQGGRESGQWPCLGLWSNMEEKLWNVYLYGETCPVL